MHGVLDQTLLGRGEGYWFSGYVSTGFVVCNPMLRMSTTDNVKRPIGENITPLGESVQLPFKDRIFAAAGSLIKGGMSCRKVSLSIALGIAFGTFPVIGSSTLLCTVAAVALRLNLPLIQAVNYAVYPLQILLLAPFITAGSRLFGNQRALMIGKNIIQQFQHDPWGSVVSLWDLVLYGAGAWMIISPLVILGTYIILKPVMHKLAASPAFVIDAKATARDGSDMVD